MKRLTKIRSTSRRLAFVATMVAGAPCAAQDIVYYDSEGFETPKYVQGTLAGSTFSNGQDFWVGIAFGGSVNLDKMTVQDQVVKSGSAAAKFDSEGHGAFTQRPELNRGTIFSLTHDYMVLDIDIRLSSSPSLTQEWILATQQTAVLGLQQFGILANGQMRAVDRLNNVVVTAQQTFTRDEWHHLTAVFDYSEFNVTSSAYYLDGELLFDIPATQVNLGLFGLVGFFCETPGTDSLYFDNLTIINTDSPLSGCYADCDGSGGLNILDYICFGDDFAANGTYADCDGNGSLNILDYICFGDAFAAGCP